MNRQDLEEMYEEETGLDAKRGAARIDILEKAAKGLSKDQFSITDNPDEINYGWQEGRRWFAGKRIGDTICLGYTNRGMRANNCVNAVFVTIHGLQDGPDTY